MVNKLKNTQKNSPSNIRRLAWLLDSSIRLPGGFRIGLDGIIGLIPGVGDLLTSSLSMYIIGQAARLNVPVVVLVRMVGNVILELVVGSIPVIGDIFDFAFKANERNMKLIDAHMTEPEHNRKQSKWALIGTLAVALIILIFIVVLLFKGLSLLLSRLTM